MGVQFERLVTSDLPPAARRRIRMLVALATVGPLLSIVPYALWRRLGTLTPDPAFAASPAGGLISGALIVAGCYAIVAAGEQTRGLARHGLTLAAALLAALCSFGSMRRYLELAASRRFWRPEAAFTNLSELPTRTFPLLVGSVLFGLVLAASIGALAATAGLATRSADAGRAARAAERWTLSLLVALVALHAAGAWVLSDATGEALGMQTPGIGGAASPVPFLLSTFALWFATSDLFALEALIAVIGAVATARLLATILGSEELRTRIDRRFTATHRVPLLLGALMVVAGAVGMRQSFGIDLGWITDRAGRQQAAASALNTTEVTNGWIVMAAAALTAIALTALVLLAILSPALELTDWRARLVLDHLPIVLVGGVLLLPIAGAVLWTLGHDAGSLVEIARGPTYGEFWSQRSTSAVARQSTGEIAAPGLTLIAVIAGIRAFAVKELRWTFTAIAGAAIACMAFASTTDSAWALLVFGGFLTIATGFVRSLSDDPIWSSIALAVASMALLGAAYRASPDLPPGLLLAGSAAMSYGLLADGLRRGRAIDEGAVLRSLIAPLLLAGLAIARATSPSVTGTSSGASAIGTLAFPLLGIPLLMFFMARDHLRSSAASSDVP